MEYDIKICVYYLIPIYSSNLSHRNNSLPDLIMSITVHVICN